MNKIWLYWSGSDGWTAKPSVKKNKVFLPFEDFNISFENAGNETLIRQKLYEMPNGSSQYSDFVVQHIDRHVNEAQIGDWIVLPGRFGSLFHMGEVMSDYSYEYDEDYGLHHSRNMHWFAKNIPALGFPVSLSNTLSEAPQAGPYLLNPKQTDDFQSLFRYRIF